MRAAFLCPHTHAHTQQNANARTEPGSFSVTSGNKKIEHTNIVATILQLLPMATSANTDIQTTSTHIMLNARDITVVMY